MIPIPYRDENPSKSFPILTVILILVNIYFYLVPNLRGTHDVLITNFGFIPHHILANPLGLLTSLFLHANLLHLISNMWFLWLFGDNIEDSYGRLSFLSIYLVSGLVGNFSHAILTGFTSQIPLIGASGAVAGVMGAYLVRFGTKKIRCLWLLIIFPVFFSIRAFWFIGFWFLFEFLAAFSFAPSNVAHWAHVGGFVYGFWWSLRKNERLRVSRLKRYI